ncbi:MAG: hypothetical protein SV487_06745 [Thermodesulfobacteriota bacterium]|nr:hypothetical protein [Thermodesulfobacteriota bacterium]
MGCGSRAKLTDRNLPGCRRRSLSIWLPERIVARDPNVTALTVSRDAFINKVWINDAAAANARIDPHHIPGRHTREFLAPWEADIIESYIREVIYCKVCMRRIVTLTIPTESKRRLVRLLPLNPDAALAYLIRPDLLKGHLL